MAGFGSYTSSVFDGVPPTPNPKASSALILRVFPLSHSLSRFLVSLMQRQRVSAGD